MQSMKILKIHDRKSKKAQNKSTTPLKLHDPQSQKSQSSQFYSQYKENPQKNFYNSDLARS